MYSARAYPGLGFEELKCIDASMGAHLCDAPTSVEYCGNKDVAAMTKMQMKSRRPVARSTLRVTDEVHSIDAYSRVNEGKRRSLEHLLGW